MAMTKSDLIDPIDPNDPGDLTQFQCCCRVHGDIRGFLHMSNEKLPQLNTS